MSIHWLLLGTVNNFAPQHRPHVLLLAVVRKYWPGGSAIWLLSFSVSSCLFGILIFRFSSLHFCLFPDLLRMRCNALKTRGPRSGLSLRHVQSTPSTPCWNLSCSKIWPSRQCFQNCWIWFQLFKLKLDSPRNRQLQPGKKHGVQVIMAWNNLNNEMVCTFQ